MTSKRCENKNLASFMFFFSCCNFLDGVWKFFVIVGYCVYVQE